MPKRDIVVVGASSGGVEALKVLVGGLPADFPAAVFIVWHLSPQSPNLLPSLLDQATPLPVAAAENDAPIESGRIYVAPPDRHLLLAPGRVRVTFGPRENRFRPAVDALFRSAAHTYGPRVIGVVLTGQLDDGTAGLWAIKDRGGLAIIQSPLEAAFPSMPDTARQYVAIDYELPLAAIGPTLAQLVQMPLLTQDVAKMSKELEVETRIAHDEAALEQGIQHLGTPTLYSCPECKGVLLQMKEGGIPRFRCHTGHAFSVHSLLADVTDTIESEMWSAARAIEESVLLLRELGDHLRSQHGDGRALEFEQKAQEAEQRLALIRQALNGHEKLSAEKLASAAQGQGAPSGGGPKPRQTRASAKKTGSARKRSARRGGSGAV